MGGAQRLHLATCLQLQIPVRQNASLFTVAVGSTRPRHCRALPALGQGDHGRRQGGSVSATPSGFLAANDRALEESQNRVCFSFHSDQLMENRLRRQPRISSDLQVKEAGKCCPAMGPRDRLGHWCRQGSGCHLPGYRDAARTLQ